MSTFIRTSLALVTLVLTTTLASAQNSRRTPIVEAVAKTKASIVGINTPAPGPSKTMGTGVIIDARGIVATNRHVVGKNKQVRVVLHDYEEIVGDVIVADEARDIAFIRFRTTKPITALTPVRNAELNPGETVIAVGNPLGYTNTVSVGVVSSLGRQITLPSGDALRGLIQIDASINPGNSGGPLLDINGELIGINVAVRTDAQRIAFAINTDTVATVFRAHGLDR